MKTVGITAEYNPFHNGHRFQIEEARRISGADRVLAVMSASFVQRGEPACADKFTRAEWAVRNGADAVIELPDVFSLTCAERFASFAMRILKGTGIVDAVSFGSESGDLGLLTELSETVPDSELFGYAIASGSSYPRALSEASGVKLSPNDILGVEYVRANRKYGCGFDICPVKRSSAHDSDGLGEEFSSAKAIRDALSGCIAYGRMSPAVFDGLAQSLPRNVLDSISAMAVKGTFPSTCDGLSDAVIYRFRSMSAEQIAALPEVNEGLENLFSEYALEFGSFSELIESVKSKRYTMARIKRIAMCGLLGITAELQERAHNDPSSLYARVLAVKGDGGELLSELCRRASIPVLIRGADREDLPPLAREVERISALAHTVNALGRPYEKGAFKDTSRRLITVEG